MIGGFPSRYLPGLPWGALLAALLIAQPAQAGMKTGRVPTGFQDEDQAPRSDALLKQVMLDAHNGERRALGLPSLTWNDALAADAGRYATQMARTNLFQHSTRTDRSTPSGENLWMGSRRFYPYAAMVGSFLEERTLFRPEGKLPAVSRSGQWQDVGHYTQMIWRGTRQLGCAIGDGADYEYLVCRYYPAGNIFGQGPLDADPVASTVLASGGQ